MRFASRIKKTALTLVSIFIFMTTWILGGCGGGTSGTGGRVYDGSLRRAFSQLPVPNVMVTVLEVDSTGVTDDQGEFRVESSKRTESATFLFETEEFSLTVVVSGIPSSANLVEASFEIAEDNSEVTTKSVDSKVSSGRGSSGGSNSESGEDDEDSSDHSNSSNGNGGDEDSSDSSSNSEVNQDSDDQNSNANEHDHENDNSGSDNDEEDQEDSTNDDENSNDNNSGPGS